MEICHLKPPTPRSAKAFPQCNSRSRVCLLSPLVTGSLAVLVISGLTNAVAMTTKNWSVHGYTVRMGLWEFCVVLTENATWSCFQVNAEFSVATQSFSVLACLCYTAMGILFTWSLLCPSLQKSRPFVISLCFLAFSVVCLQVMTLVVYGKKHGDFVTDVHFGSMAAYGRQTLSWSYFLEAISTLLATVSGVLLLVEFKHLNYKDIFQDRENQSEDFCEVI